MKGARLAALDTEVDFPQNRCNVSTENANFLPLPYKCVSTLLCRDRRVI